MTSHWSWWRHQMETFSTLLALCAGNSPVTGNSPHKGQWCGALSPSHASWRCDRMSDSTAIFRQACLAEVTDRIRNQVLVKRLTATSSKITKISWWEMLLNYRWNWCWRSWQIARHVNMCNLNDFVCCIPQMKREFRASFHQSTKFPTSIDRQT